MTNLEGIMQFEMNILPYKVIFSHLCPVPPPDETVKKLVMMLQCNIPPPQLQTVLDLPKRKLNEPNIRLHLVFVTIGTCTV